MHGSIKKLLLLNARTYFPRSFSIQFSLIQAFQVTHNFVTLYLRMVFAFWYSNAFLEIWEDSRGLISFGSLAVPLQTALCQSK